MRSERGYVLPLVISRGARKNLEVDGKYGGGEVDAKKPKPKFGLF
jgi:hypothetical protein